MEIRFDRTIAYKNRNPLNIRTSSSAWLGKVGDNVGFCVFSGFSLGYRAAVMILRSYSKRGWVTVPQIIEHWAPASENKTTEYIKCVLDTIGERQTEPYYVGPETAIDLNNRELVIQLLLAMTKVEMGANCAQVHKMQGYAAMGYDLAVTSPGFFS